MPGTKRKHVHYAQRDLPDSSDEEVMNDPNEAKEAKATAAAKAAAEAAAAEALKKFIEDMKKYTRLMLDWRPEFDPRETLSPLPYPFFNR